MVRKPSLAGQFQPILKNIPLYMQSINGWCFATDKKVPVSIYRGNDEPFDYIDKQKGRCTKFLPTGKVNDPKTWGSFDMLEYSPFGNNRGGTKHVATDGDFVAVPAFALKAEHGLRCFDIDRIQTLDEINEPRRATGREPMDEAAYKLTRNRAMMAREIIYKHLYGKTFHEQSMSGKAEHFFVRDRNSALNYKGTFCEIFAAEQFIYMTGWINPNAPVTTLLDDQAVIDKLMSELIETDCIRVMDRSEKHNVTIDDLPVDTSRGQDPGCTFETLKEYIDSNKLASTWYYTQETPANSGGDISWSQGTYNLVSHLEKKCPFPEMIFQFILNSPRLLGAGFTATGEDRYEKFINLFPNTLRKIRFSNEKHHVKDSAAVEHGAAMFEILTSPNNPESLAAKAVEQEKLAAAYEQHQEEIEYSSQVGSFIKALKKDFSWVRTDFYYPDCVFGKMASQVDATLTAPRKDYILANLLASVSGTIGRCVKIGNGRNGTSLQFLVTGKPNTGKSAAYKSILRCINFSYSSTDLFSNGIPFNGASVKDTFVQDKPESPQAVYDILMEHPACVIFVDECETMILQMLDGNDKMGVGLKRAYKMNWDSSVPGGEWTSGTSRAGNKSLRSNPILDPAVSTVMSCTENVLSKVTMSEIADGTFSRMFIIYNKEPMDDPIRTPKECANGWQNDIAYLWMRMLAEAKAINQSYANCLVEVEKDKPKVLPVIDRLRIQQTLTQILMTEEAEALFKRVNAVFYKIAQKAQSERDNSYSKEYEILARAGDNIERVASMLAYLDWRYANMDKSLTNENGSEFVGPPAGVFVATGVKHVEFATNFYLAIISRLFQGYADGEVGVGLNDDQEVVIKHMRNALLIANKKKEGWHWVNMRDLAKACTQVAPFKDNKFTTPRRMFDVTLIQLEKDGIVEVGKEKVDGAAYSTPAVKPNFGHNVWKVEKSLMPN